MRINRVFLVGPMGAGKSSTGRVLAELLRLDFVDCDSELETRSGADILWIFDVEGEDGFRAREAQLIEELTRHNDIVLATGGGAVLRRENRRALASRGFVVYLHTPVEDQMERTRNDKRRPLLQRGDAEATLRGLMAARGPLYREVADLEIDTRNEGPRALAERIASQLAKL